MLLLLNVNVNGAHPEVVEVKILETVLYRLKASLITPLLQFGLLFALETTPGVVGKLSLLSQRRNLHARW